METYFSNMAAGDGTKEKLLQDLSTLARDAEELVRATGMQMAEKSKVELARILERLKVRCSKLSDQVAVGAGHADRVIREHPYQSIGVAFGIGLLLGVLVTHDSSRE
jgi:ElaB/YqjD/DUF883 family membrane-anchored ribosome-binding protein